MDIKLLPKQAEFLNLTEKKRYPAYIGGIGSGKTYIGCTAVVKYLLENPGARGIIVAPNYRMMTRIVWPTLKEDLTWAQPMILHTSRTEGIVSLTGGSTLFLGSADKPDSLRGANLSVAYIDEAALCDEDTWRIIIGRIRQAGFRHWAAIGTTPKGKNWIWRYWFELDNKDYGVLRTKTWDNYYLDPAYVESLKASYSGVFARQELEGGFEKPEGLVYDEFERSIHVVDDLPEFNRIIAGVDFGYTNPTAIISLGFDYDDNAYAFNETYQRQLITEDIVKICRDEVIDGHVSLFYCDPAAPEAIEAICRDGLPAVKGVNAVVPGIMEVKRRLAVKGNGKPSLYVHRSCVNLLSEFEAYQWDEKKDAPVKAYDHGLDALRYALYSTGGDVAESAQSGSVYDFPMDQF